MYGIFFNDLTKDYIGHIMNECYAMKVYDYFLKSKTMNILEIGGNVGAVSLYLSQYAKHLYVLEPSKRHLKALHETVKYNNLNNVQIIPKALDVISGKKTFYLHEENTTMCSLKLKSPSYEEVECISLDVFFEEYGIETIDFMKMDVEGSEIDILTSESFKNNASKIKSMLIEYHDWAGDSKILEQALTDNNYHWQRLEVGTALYGAIRK